MSRRPDPARISAAREAALRSRLRSAGQTAERIDSMLEDWRAEAVRRDLDPSMAAYWQAAAEWLEQPQRPPAAPPKSVVV